MGGKNCKSYSIKDRRHKNEANISSKQEKMEEVIVEGVVCKVEDINENEMKLLPIGDQGQKILLIKQNGELHAIGTKCTHYGALLHTGALGEGRVRCPWHGACFNIKTGDIEDFPGLDSLPCYKVSVDNGQVKVQAKQKDLAANKKIKEFVTCQIDNSKVAVVVGGGPAGATCVDNLRQEGFTGRIVLICKEPVLPYDRVKVSKIMDFDIEKSLLRPQFFYDERKIETKLNVEATELIPSKKIIKLSNGENLKYDHVFLATGSKARTLSIPGSNLQNIFVSRNYDDAQTTFKKLSKDKNVVILGLSFIGMEVAAYCVGKVKSVTIVGNDSVPLKPVFGLEIGERAKQGHEAKGVQFIFNQTIAKLLSSDEKQVSHVELTDGTVLPADIVVLGIGAIFYTDWLKSSGIEMLENGAIVVDKYLKTNIDNVYAGGDIAYAPVFSSNNESKTIGHFALAQYHGQIAASNICGKNTELRTVPFFWSALLGNNYRYAGSGQAEKIKIYGSLESFKFFAYHINNGKVVAMSSVGTDPIVSDFANYLYEGKTLTEKEIEHNPIGWMKNKPLAVLKIISKNE
ncbi:hypothetical protein HCN44_011008 [Aphidius gifuensis]|uniref:Rieske domain-containing protein n=1 Tax=Aphidius gifuensis TaxID=684658 RepID=A0A835CZF1_APHGI|nr:apoptosis-inducing factor 3 [Aphidius gifuensis]KAF7998600.1 hypothetical protein HCN44_011008 [Aphidius gifuensis]